MLTRRYGIAYNSGIFVGKVLSNQGSGPAEAIVAGIEWAVQKSLSGHFDVAKRAKSHADFGL